MKFERAIYAGVGVNHDNEEFQGIFEVQPLSNTGTYRYTYIAIRLSDDLTLHEEFGLIGRNEIGGLVLTVHMAEMPCHTTYLMNRQENDTFIFTYVGKGNVEGFKSELVFEFGKDRFRYLHRWAMEGEVSDKSWCELVGKGAASA